MTYLKFYITLAFLSSCHFFTHSQSKNSEFKTKRAVEEYVREKKSDKSYYAPYNFLEYEKHMPTAYKDLEELIEVSKTLPTMKQHYGKKKLDSLLVLNESRIQAKKREIIDKKLHFSYEVIHSYGMKDELGTIKIYRYKFFLNHAFKIQDVRLIFAIPITKDQTEPAAYFQKRKLLYKLNDTEQDRKSSNEIHDFFEDALKENDYEPEIFYAAARMVQNILDFGNVKLDIYGLRAIKEFIETARPDLKGYKAVDYSHFLELTDSSADLQYVMYHKYDYKEGKRKETDVVGIYFDKYFVIRKLERIDGDTDKLFEKD
jgi:hypothetical protein